MPPKQKKPPQNAYYFFMVKRKGEMEREGHRFPGGMKDVALAVGAEWNRLTDGQKRPFEEQAKAAKEEGKHDLNNKFTATGESFASVQARMAEERALADLQENYIDGLGSDEESLDRMFVLIKTIHSVEEITERNERIYWPLEIGLVAFSLRNGLKSVYWTLVDTKQIPVGYASAAKETSEDTGLPEPGSKLLKEEYRDYTKLMKNIKGFIESWCKKSYRLGPVVFAMDQEIDCARGFLKWMANRVDESIMDDCIDFACNLKMYKLPKLILRFAINAHHLNPDYQFHDGLLYQYKLEHHAVSILNKGCYDYKDEITCDVHKTEEASSKMYTCCKNVVMRRMYLLFEHMLPAFGLEMKERHDINQLAAKSKASRAPPPIRPPVYEDIDTSLSKATAELSIESTVGQPVGHVPWGRKQEVPAASFASDDFPALGSAPQQSSSAVWGRRK